MACAIALFCFLPCMSFFAKYIRGKIQATNALIHSSLEKEAGRIDLLAARQNIVRNDDLS